ncbi:hypothetical protein RND71_044165 [Anisodus tanguticus]|uniref:ABC transporter domain-containing protein n=1 Tax=Anisodus tanguticus TaxID=243964 RepID=A0AAE1QRL9_9SOLA|nr:hypothetical protein RND71_044165 [Anisodus tanguticus]
MEVDIDSQVKNVVNSYFTEVDEEVSDYIQNVLKEGSKGDFSKPDDIYECLGELFEDIITGSTKDSVLNLCKKIFSLIVVKQNTDDVQANRKLNAPIHLGNIFSLQENMYNDYKSIWCAQKEVQSQVNKGKLNKAEAKLKLKQEKRIFEKTIPTTATSASWQKEASTSQMISKTVMKSDETGKTKDIKIENFDISFGDKKLLQNAELSLSYGRRYGLVGRNGIGKSTLLKMISNGSLVIPKNISLLHVEQEVEGDDTTALESVLESDQVRSNLLKEEKELLSNSSENSANRLQEVFNELQAIEADKAPSRASKILFGLGFTPEMQERATKTFSGGWRMRIALARALFSRPDLLLLDEPTNMLDMKAVIWLENYLVNSWASILLVVSHDRSFLNNVSTDVLHFHSQRIDNYKGNYDNFMKAKVEKRRNQEKEYEAQLAFRKHVQEFIDKFRYNAKRASLVQSKIKMIEKLPVLVPVEKEVPVILKFPESEPLSGAPILQLDETSFRYSNETPLILENVSISANLDSRICIVGDNGSGKTTLLKILTGQLEPSKGLRNVHRNLRIGYFSQHHVDQLNLNQNSIEFLAAKFPGQNAEAYRSFLGKFGVSGDLGLQPIASLSGGQKSRVAFAAVAMLNPNLLILDEPTNHLDVETVEALGNAINKFKGGVILVSHDQQLLEMVCKELWLVKDKTVETIKGGFEEYRRIVYQVDSGKIFDVIKMAIDKNTVNKQVDYFSLHLLAQNHNHGQLLNLKK